MKKDKTITQFLDNEYREYSKYVVHSRAIPNMIDGFKPVQRKIFWTGLKHCKTQFLKTIALTGYCMAESFYHHGDASANAAISNLTQDFPGANNIPMFLGQGSFGNRLIQEAASPRYTMVKVNPEFLKYFVDFEILDKTDDPEDPVPINYLPIIPWVLVNGIDGIAIGFATSILPRNPELITKIIKEKLEHNKNFTYKSYKPYWKGFKGTIEYFDENKNWIVTGAFERDKKGVIIVKELPIGFNREKYIEHLEKMIERKKIKDYTDYSKDGFLFEVKLEDKTLDDDGVIQILRLRTTMTENIVVIDQHNKLRIFESPDTLVNEFISYRLEKYKERIIRNIEISKEETYLIDEKIKFIKMVQHNEINFLKQTKQDIEDFLKKNDFRYIKELMTSQIYKFAKDEIQKLITRKEELTIYIRNLNKTTPKEEWLKEL